MSADKDRVARSQESIVEVARRDIWERDLIPTANINNSIGKIDSVDVAEYILLLLN